MRGLGRFLPSATVAALLLSSFSALCVAAFVAPVQVRCYNQHARQTYLNPQVQIPKSKRRPNLFQETTAKITTTTANQRTTHSRLQAIVTPWSGLPSDTLTAWWSMSFLALQFACQPILTKTYAPKNIARSTYVLAGDFLKVLLCAGVLTLNSSWSVVGQQWSPMTTLIGAGIPAVLYSIQNYCSLMAYQHLAPISYNVLNQTKTLSAAIFCYFLLSKRQSKIQMVSLILLIGSALILEKVIPIRRQPQQTAENSSSRDNSATNNTNATSFENQQVQETEFLMGVVPILIASSISGLAGAICQKALQELDRDPMFFSLEISFCSASVLLLSLLLGNPDLKKIGNKGITHGWTFKTWIPILTNAIGGILVGIVTKYAGSVRKGFALVFGLFLSGVLQNMIQTKGQSRVSLEQAVGGFLAGMSLWMHSSFPPAS